MAYYTSEYDPLRRSAARGGRPMNFSPARIPNFSSSRDGPGLGSSFHPSGGVLVPAHVKFSEARQPRFTSSSELSGPAPPTSPTFSRAGNGAFPGTGFERPRVHSDEYTAKYLAWQQSGYEEYKAVLDRIGKTDEQLKEEAAAAAKARADELAAQEGAGGIEVVDQTKKKSSKEKSKERKEREKEKAKEARAKQKEKERAKKEREKAKEEERKKEKEKKREKEKQKEREKAAKKKERRSSSSKSDSKPVIPSLESILADTQDVAVEGDGGVPISPTLASAKVDKKVNFAGDKKKGDKDKSNSKEKDEKKSEDKKDGNSEGKKGRGGAKESREAGEVSSAVDDGGVMIIDVGAPLHDETGPVVVVGEPETEMKTVTEAESLRSPKAEDKGVENAEDKGEVIDDAAAASETTSAEESKGGAAEAEAKEVAVEEVSAEADDTKEEAAAPVEEAVDKATTAEPDDTPEEKVAAAADAIESHEAGSSKAEATPVAGESKSPVAEAKKPKKVKISDELFGSDDDSDLDMSVAGGDVKISFLGALEDAPANGGKKKEKKKGKGK